MNNFNNLICFNFGKWGIGHPLWITGVSGDGKTKLSEAIYENTNKSINIISLDLFLTRLTCEEESFNKIRSERNYIDNSLLFEYIDSHPELPRGLKPMKTDLLRYENEKDYFIDFFKWIINKSKRINKHVLVEGVDILLYASVNWLYHEPVIIIKSSLVRLIKQRLNRRKTDNINLKENINIEIEKIPIIKTEIKERDRLIRLIKKKHKEKKE